MSFDEQPDGDPHGECAAEIRILQNTVESLNRECYELNDRWIGRRRTVEDLAMMCRRLSYQVKRDGNNDKLVGQCVTLLKSYNLGGSVIKENLVADDCGGLVRLADIPKYKFPNVSCSQCGGEFGPGDHGFSYCENHKHLPRLS